MCAERMREQYGNRRCVCVKPILDRTLLLILIFLIFFSMAVLASAKTHYINSLGDSDFSFGSGDAFFIDSSAGRVGIGTSDPGTLFKIDKAGDLLLQDDGSGSVPGNISFRTSSDSILAMVIANDSGSNEYIHLCAGGDDAGITIDDDGYIGINTTTPGSPLDIRSTMQQISLNYSSSEYAGFTSDSSGYVTLEASGDRIYLGEDDSDVDVVIPDGGLAISTSSVAPSIPSDGDVEVEDGIVCISGSSCGKGNDGELYVHGNGFESYKIHASGLPTTTTPLGYYQLLISADKVGAVKAYISSERFKTDIRDLQVDSDDFLGLQPVEFRDKFSGLRGIGLIAEDVVEKVPELVVFDGEGRPDGVSYTLLGVFAIDAAKDNQVLIDENDRLLRDIESLGPVLDSRLVRIAEKVDEAESVLDDSVVSR